MRSVLALGLLVTCPLTVVEILMSVLKSCAPAKRLRSVGMASGSA
jgi:hypothetical protein